MNPTELRGRLSQLHEQLANNPNVDRESQQLLRTLLVDIERVLDQPDASHGAVPSHEHRLEQLATRFEADYPALAGVLRQFVDVLGKAGL